MEKDIIRIRRLYRIPTIAASRRALELTAASESILHGSDWKGGVEVGFLSGANEANALAGPLPATGAGEPSIRVADAAKPLPFADDSYDIVVLHRTLDELAATARREGRRFVAADFLSEVAGKLATGGVVAGCFANRYGVRNVWHRVRHRFAMRSDGGDAGEDSCRAWLSVRSCYRALEQSGLEDIRLFSVLPGPDRPYRLLSIEKGLSRRASRRQVDTLRRQVAPITYAAWRVLAEFGLSQHFEDSIFFWGRKRC